MKEFWDERYAEEGWAYGTEPNEYLRESLATINNTGKLLLPAEGQGRNAVYAASIGWDVDAFDQSASGQKRALGLAEDRGVTIDFKVGDFGVLSDVKDKYDVAAMIYVHFPPEMRTTNHRLVIETLKPGGELIIEGFSVSNLPLREVNPKVGGPDKKELLFTGDAIEKDLEGMEILELKEERVQLNEGKYHVGEAIVIRCRARKL